MSPRFLVQLEGGKANVSLARLAEVAEALDTSLVSLLAGLGPVSDAPDRAASVVLAAPGDVQDRLLARLDATPTKVALIGLRGAGKTTIGRTAAETLGLPFVQLDREIESAAGLSLATIFELHGPEGYRERARTALRNTLRHEGPAIVEVGGSVILDEVCEQLLWSEAVVVWLSAPPNAHLERVAAQGDTRPMAGHRHALAEIEAILGAREPIHRRAHVHVDTANGLQVAVEAVIGAARSLTDARQPASFSSDS